MPIALGGRENFVMLALTENTLCPRKGGPGRTGDAMMSKLFQLSESDSKDTVLSSLPSFDFCAQVVIVDWGLQAPSPGDDGAFLFAYSVLSPKQLDL